MTVVLVTGSARGLGMAVARAARERGDRVHVVWRSSDNRAPGLRAEFGEERIHRADLADEEEARALVETVVAREGRLDHLVHAVGAYASGSTSAIGADEVERLWRSNVLTAQHALDAARPHLRRSPRGRAVFFGTAGLAGLRARRRTAAYAAAKSALAVLVRSWALEEAPHGTTVNLVSPGHVPHDAAHADTLDPEQHAKLPMGRAGRPEDVAAAVSWLLSDAAAYVTGADLPVSGGWML